MADDRYNWLDEETAERLLRGLPVDAQNSRRGRKKDRARERNRNDRTGQGALNVPGDAWFEEADRRTAERLASVLDALATEHTHVDTPAHGSTAVELPGEAAALDAFRAARVGVLHSGSVGMTGATNDSGSDSASAADAGSGRGERRGRGRRRAHGERRIGSVLGGRPLRAGFAVALAGCALGGVAVAAGAGVLPTPFGGKGTPAVSVSPVESADEERVGGSGGTGGDPSEDDDTRDTSGGEADRDPDGKKSEKSGSPDDRSSASDGPTGRSGDKGEGHGDGQGENEDGQGDSDQGGGSQDKQALASALCTAYDEGKLSSGDRRKLERAAGGRAVVQKFCAKYGSPGGGSDIAGGAGSVGGGGANGGPGGSGNSGGAGGSGGNHDTGGGTGGSTGKPGDAGGSTGGDEDGGSSAGSGGEDDSGGSATPGTTSGSASVAPDAAGTAGETVTGATPAG